MSHRYDLAACAVFVIAFCLAPAPASARNREAIAVQFVLKEGSTVSDKITVVAKVTGADDIGIDKVEFLVDDQLKSTDTSTPYSFDWDTIDETEGKHKLTATAFDAQGRSQRATIMVVVDNELSKGADYHAQQALAALKGNKPDVALGYARRAIKIDPQNKLAVRAFAGIQRQKGEYDKALAMLEKLDLPDNDVEARQELVAIYMARGSAAATTEEFLADATKAVEVFNKMAANRAAVAGSEPIVKGDAHFAAREWKSAIQQYQKCGLGEEPPAECANRLVLAYINGGRLKEAQQMLTSLGRARKGDDATQALNGMTLLREHQFSKAREAVQQGVENESLSSLIVAAYADLALKQPKKARDEADKAYQIAPKLPEVLLLRALATDDAIDGEKAIMQALAIDPGLSEAYTVRGFQVLMSRGSKRYAVADQLFDFALKRDPNNTYAQLGTALSLLVQKRTNEADPLLNQAVAQDPAGPDIHVARALSAQIADKGIRIHPELNQARKLDSDRWNEDFVPQPMELVKRTFFYRFPVMLSPTSLYPPKMIDE